MTRMTIAIPQFSPQKGNLQGNLDRIGELLQQSSGLEPRPNVVVFAETILSGYFVEGGVRDVALTADQLLAAVESRYRTCVTNSAPLDVVLGFYEVLDGNLHNSAACIALRPDSPARILHVHRKNFLPTYSLFDEERFVERGYGIEAFDTSWGRVALLVCEDAWHSLTGTIAALDGAQIVCVLAAAPARGVAPRRDDAPGPGSVQRWERLVRDIAEEHGVFCVLSNLVGNEGGRIFQGGSLVVGPRGDVRMRAPVFEEALLSATIDTRDIARVRAELPMLSDLKTALPFLRTEIDRAMAGRPGWRAADKPTTNPPTANLPTADSRSGPPTADSRSGTPTADSRSGPPLTVIADPHQSLGQPPSLDIDPALVESWLITFLRDEFRNRGFSKAVIGISGGVDSAVVAALAARALGPENVIGVQMPYRTSSADSRKHGEQVIRKLGIQARLLDISDAVDGYLANEPDADAARRGNVMARMRMISLFDLSAKHNALPLGTGNKSERLLGYFTWHADDSPPINPIGDLFKTQVWALATWLGIPHEIITKPATADLIEGQTDEGDFGVSYSVADDVLNWILNGWTVDELIARGMKEESVKLVTKRLNSTHWKRKLPTVAMMSGTAIGEGYLRPVDSR